MSRKSALFGFSVLWFVLGAAFFVAVLLFFRPSVSNDYAYALSLYKNSKSQDFIHATGLYLPRASLDETKKLLRLSIEIEAPSLSKETATSLLNATQVGFLKDETVFSLLKVMQRRAYNPNGMVTLYGGAQKPFDNWIAELDDEKGSNGVQRLSRLLSLATKGEATSFSNLFQRASVETKSPEVLYGAALLNALRGDMERALEYYPVSINKEHLEGRVDLLVSAGKRIEAELVARIDAAKDKPKLVAMKAQEAYRSGAFAEAFRTYFLLLSRLPVNVDNVEIADALLYFTKHQDNKDELKTLTRQSNELLHTWKSLITIPVPLDSFGFDDADESGEGQNEEIGHDQAISALWFEFGKAPTDARLWKTLAWFLVHDRDDRGLEKLLARIKTPLDPYYLLYSGCLSIMREQLDGALSYFDQSGKAGLAEGYLCKAAVLSWQGKPADAKEAENLAQHFIFAKGAVSNDATKDPIGH